jgi:hypothetical protein
VQFDIDPTLDFDDKSKSEMKKQIEEFEHGFRRYLTTRGLTMKEMQANVADFQNPVNAIMSLISAGTGIPQRVLMGSEQGKLAAKMDRSNWDDRVADRRDDFAGPYIVRPFAQRLIDAGALPTPESFDVRWTQLKILDDEQRAEIATEWSGFNQAAGETVVTADEIRERVLGLPPLAEVQGASPEGQEPVLAPVAARKWRLLSAAKKRHYLKAAVAVAAARKEAPAWKHVHQAADRFRTRGQADRPRSVQERAASRERQQAEARSQGS